MISVFIVIIFRAGSEAWIWKLIFYLLTEIELEYTKISLKFRLNSSIKSFARAEKSQNQKQMELAIRLTPLNKRKLFYQVKPLSISFTSFVIMFKYFPTERSFSEEEEIRSNFLYKTDTMLNLTKNYNLKLLLMLKRWQFVKYYISSKLYAYNKITMAIEMKTVY